MAINSRVIVAFFVEFERALQQLAPPGVFGSSQVETLALLQLFRNHSGCEFEALEADFDDGLDLRDAANERGHTDKPAKLWSFVLNFGTRAEVVVNNCKKSDGEWLVNHCHRRFLLLKEALHVILRDELLRNGQGHPDTGDAEKLITLTEQLIFLPFSIIDFDSPRYSDGVKVEHAAELLAFLLLYPFDIVAKDRKAFLSIASEGDQATYDQPEIILADTMEFALRHMVPNRYVDLLFRWSRFDHLYMTYCQLRDGYHSF